jgi:predicted dehydrogenase
VSEKKNVSRRNFLKNSSVAAAGVSLGMSRISAPAFAQTKSANEVINVGIIGTGSRGNFLADQTRKVDNIRITDLCDIYPPHLEQGFERNGSKGRKHTDYRKLLEQKEIDAVVVATPLVEHIPQSLAAVQLGKDVFCEKSLAYTVKEANDIVEAVRYYDVKFMVGYSRWTSATEEVKRMVDEGAIGKPHHVFTHYHRNNTWVRPIEDPRWFRILNWRLYWEYCGGQMTELVSHQITRINYILDSHPLAAVGTGAVDFYTQYDRETWDNVDVIFEYPNNIKINSTSNFMNAKMGVSEEIQGTNGTIHSYGRNIKLYWERETEHLATIGIKGAHAKVKLGETLNVDESPTQTPGKEVLVEGERRSLMGHFFDCMRNDKEPVINVEEGRVASISALMANQAIRLGRKVTWDEMLRTT